ncbi:MAG: sigma-70 family RNA polymerase sigma factor [Balneola sp.]|nr:MAG: sigma-70 family RNA polymerase sigma factor [Balneola sp.]
MEKTEPHTASNIVEHLFRHQSGKMSAILTRIFGFKNVDLIEDIIQETFLSAIKTWGLKGEPENPEAWLMLVAKNKIINELNRKKRHAEKREKIHFEQAEEEIDELFLDHEIKDSQLRLLFACCHPDLKPKAQIMLTLKVMSGFGDKEIANALLMQPEAVKKTIFRAKQQLKEKHDTIGIPFLSAVTGRLDIVLTIIYLMFNEGYKTTRGDQVINEELCYEAIRLSLLLVEVKNIDQGKIYALLSLMYFSLARFPSRVNSLGEMIEIGEQDRSKWDQELIEMGLHFLKKSRQSSELSRYHLESTIASIHCTSDSMETTDWNVILYCYQKLLVLNDSFVVRLNHAIALSRVEGFQKGVEILKQMEEHSKSSRRSLLYAAIAEMNMQLGKYDIAKSYYQVALDQSDVNSDRAFIGKKILECDKKNIQNN